MFSLVCARARELTPVLPLFFCRPMEVKLFQHLAGLFSYMLFEAVNDIQ